MTGVPTALSFVGIAKEAVKGTGVAATNYLAVKTITPEDVITQLPVNAYKGAMAETFGFVQGLKHTTFEVGGPVFADTLPWVVAGILGDITTVAGRTVTDGATTAASTTVTSATANFGSADVGSPISGGSIPAGATIASVTNATTAVISAAATATAAAVSLTIGTLGVNKHVVAARNSGDGQATSHTLLDFYGVTQARQFAGHQWSDCTIKFAADGLLEHTSKGTGLVPSLQVTKPTQSFSAVLPVPSWAGIVTVGGAAQATVGEGEIVISRKIELIPGLNGTQQYQQVFQGAAKATVKFTAYVGDDTEMLRYLNNTQPSIDLNFMTGSGAALQQILFHCTTEPYLKAKIERGKEYVTIAVETEAVANVTDAGASGGYSPGKFTFQNALPAGTYI